MSQSRQQAPRDPGTDPMGMHQAYQDGVRKRQAEQARYAQERMDLMNRLRDATKRKKK